ncbi:porin [Paraburkholderia phosphatilytica]|uniref:porin n=1 Tax=Paraburkholderia phosphatilytica TaxID=2282883 RepID=UPI000E48A598|nr:porin [Paraburkholderia phosphatilytica]
MKATRLALAAGLAFASIGAHAQSSVTLFGVLDEGINFTNNSGGSRAWQTASVDLATSRWGLKGSEDLGGGLHAIFDLESGVELDNGSAYYDGRLFGYQSFVGLQSDSMGTLTFGRQFDTVSDTIGLMTANGNWAGYLFAHPLDNDNTDASFHASNSVKYTTRDYGGFSATALYGFSNQAGGFAQNRVYGIGAKYSYKTLSLGAVYEDLSASGTTSQGAVASDDYGFVAANQKIYGAAGSYGIGPAVLSVAYTHVALQQPTSSIYVGNLGLNDAGLRFDNIEFNAKYNITPSLFVGGMYTYTIAHLKEDGSSSSVHWNQLGLMGQYSLSARTALYAQVVYQKANGGAEGSVLADAYIPGSAGVSSNSHQVVARVGITHSF